MKSKMMWIISVCLLSLPAATLSSNILLWASPIGVSHSRHMALVANVLSSSPAQHRVTLLTYNMRTKPSVLGESVEWLDVVNDEQDQLMGEVGRLEASMAWENMDWTSSNEMMSLWKLWIHNYCVNLLQDKKLADTLLSRSLDLVVTDPFSGYCSLAYTRDVLLVPYIFYETSTLATFLAHHANLASPLSYVPAQGSGLTDHMTFTDRLHNIFTHYSVLYFFHYNTFIKTADDAMLEVRMSGTPVSPNLSSTTTEAIQNASLFVVNTDISLEFVRPTAPNLVFVGGITAKPAQPLAKEFEDIMSRSGDAGVVIFSLGTEVLAEFLPESAVEIFLSAFSQLKQTVIWKFDGEIEAEKLPSNVIYRPWLPQSDILGHKQTRCFLSHGGLNGVMEAVYHGVPLVGVPVWGDQADNIIRLEAKAAAIHLPRQQLSKESLLHALTRCVEEKSFKENMMRLSRILRDHPQTAQDRLIYWVEYVIRHEGAYHLTSEALANLSWYQYLLIDVTALLISTLSLAMCCILQVCTICWRKCPTQQNVTKEKTN